MKQWVSLLCVVSLLLCCCGVLSPVSAAAGKYGVSFKMFPPAEFGEQLTVPVKAGKKLATKYNGCGVQLPAALDLEYAALYIRAEMDAVMAAALNDAAGYVEIGNNLGDIGGTMEWSTSHVTWQEGMNEVVFRFESGIRKSVDLTAVLNWFQITSAPVETDTAITFYEVAVVDATEGGMEFGKNDTFLQMTKPLTATPNTIEVSVRVDPQAELTAERYAIFSSRGSDDARPIALSMLADGKLRFQWGTGKVFEVNCDVRTGEWVDIAVVRNMTDRKFYVYLDGMQKASFDAAGTPDILPTVPHAIAADADGSATFMGGIADIRVWSDARTQKEIQDNRVSKRGNGKNGIAADAEGLLGNWYILGTTDYVLATLPDASACKNDLVFRGTRASQWLDYDKTQYDFLYDKDGNEDYYSMVIVPDIQNLSTAAYEKEWLKTAGWIADNVERENIVHVIGLGDSSWQATAREYERARLGWDLFTDKVSWNNVPGNHDYPWDREYRYSAVYANAFGEEYLNSTASKGVYQGYFEDPYGRSTVENSYYCFGVNGVRWMVLQLEFAPRQHVMDWANERLEEYADHNVIVVTHGYLNGDGTRCNCWQAFMEYDEEEGGYMGSTTTVMWDKMIRNNDNVKMVLCGHNRNAEGSIAIRQDENDAGHLVPQIMINAQALDVGDDISPSYFEGRPMGMLGILRFSADGTQAALQYYSPLHDGSYHVASNSITLSMDIQQATDCTHEETKEKLVGVTCKEAGVKRTLCKECGVLLNEEAAGPLTTHTWDAGAVTKEPTATSEDERTFTCTVCGDTRVEPIAKNGTLGDVDGSGKVDSTDARLTLQYAVKKIDGTKLTLAAADVDGNGKVDSTDARLILQYAVKKIQTFPAA